MKNIFYFFVFFILFHATAFTQNNCHCAGELTIGVPSHEDCDWTLSIGNAGTGNPEFMFTEEGQYQVILPSPLTPVTIAVTSLCDTLTLPVFYNFCGEFGEVIFQLTSPFSVEYFEFDLNEDCNYECAASRCSCNIEYTITNDTDNDWTGNFVGTGAASPCNENLAVPAHSSTTYTGTVDANEPGVDDIRYVIASNNNFNFTNPNLTIDFTSACALNLQINNSGVPRIIPENDNCGSSVCDFTFQADGCTVCFTALNHIPGVDHVWDFDGDGTFDETTSNTTICTTYDEPGGTFNVNHLHDDLICEETITVSCEVQDTCPERDYNFVRTCGYPPGFACPETASSPTACEVECCDDENPGQVTHLMITRNIPNPFGTCERSFACGGEVINWYDQNGNHIHEGLVVNYPHNGLYAAYAVIDMNINDDIECKDTVFIDIDCPVICENPGFDIVTNPNCPPAQYCSICTGGGEVCVTYADGSPIDGYAVFFLEDNNSIPSGDGCIYVSAATAKKLTHVEVYIDGCVFTVPIEFNDPECSAGFAPYNDSGVNTKNDQLEIFPNPATQVLKVYNSSESDLEVMILTVDGGLMAAFNLAAYEVEKLEVKTFPNGIYILKVNHPLTGEILQIHKVIISH